MSGNCSELYPWFAVRVKPRREKYVALLLRHKGYAEFLPLYRARRRWSDRFKEIELALFPGYLFCRFDPCHRVPVLTTPGVSCIVGVGKIPIPVDEAEVGAIQDIVQLGLGVGPWPFLQVGHRVRLEEGPLSGLEGILIETKDQHRLVVSVTLLQRSVAVEIDRHWVRPISALPRIPAVAAAFPAARGRGVLPAKVG